ncbi:MAG: hypothetical protein ABIJ40_09520 [Bacteroidota bacterium]
MSIVLSVTNQNLDLSVTSDAQTLEVTNATIELTLSNDTIVYNSGIPDGSVTGDIIRWNETTGAWEVKAEPILFNGLVLNPMSAPLDDIEGGLWYKDSEKSVFVCTDI